MNLSLDLLKIFVNELHELHEFVAPKPCILIFFLHLERLGDHGE